MHTYVSGHMICVFAYALCRLAQSPSIKSGRADESTSGELIGCIFGRLKLFCGARRLAFVKFVYTFAVELHQRYTFSFYVFFRRFRVDLAALLQRAQRAICSFDLIVESAFATAQRILTVTSL